MRIGAVADDLTGALDVAAAFADRGLIADVLLNVDAAASATVTVIDTDSRDAAPEVAAERARRAMRALGSVDIPFKKIDSTLRGSWAAEIAAVAAGRPVLFAPANPAQGRTFAAGRVRVNGNGIEHPDVAAALAGLDAAAPDCLGNDDLDQFVAEARPGTLFVGSGGLAAALARRYGGAPAPRPEFVSEVRPLVVAGSATSTTHRQLDRLRASRPGAEILAAPRTDGEAAGIVSELAARAVALLSPGRPAILTGGETARAVLEGLGVSRLRCRGHLLAGLPLSEAVRAGADFTVVTKAGGFGSESALLDAFDLLSPPQT